MLILCQLHQVKFLVSATHEVTSNIVRNSKDETILHMFANENQTDKFKLISNSFLISKSP